MSSCCYLLTYLLTYLVVKQWLNSVHGHLIYVLNTSAPFPFSQVSIFLHIPLELSQFLCNSDIWTGCSIWTEKDDAQERCHCWTIFHCASDQDRAKRMWPNDLSTSQPVCHLYGLQASVSLEVICTRIYSSSDNCLLYTVNHFNHHHLLGCPVLSKLESIWKSREATTNMEWRTMEQVIWGSWNSAGKTWRQQLGMWPDVSWMLDGQGLRRRFWHRLKSVARELILFCGARRQWGLLDPIKPAYDWCRPAQLAASIFKQLDQYVMY